MQIDILQASGSADAAVRLLHLEKERLGSMVSAGATNSRAPHPAREGEPGSAVEVWKGSGRIIARCRMLLPNGSFSPVEHKTSARRRRRKRPRSDEGAKAA